MRYRRIVEVCDENEVPHQAFQDHHSGGETPLDHLRDWLLQQAKSKAHNLKDCPADFQRIQLIVKEEVDLRYVYSSIP
jgi:hypothetical protein